MMYLGLDRTATGLCDTRRIVEVESRCEREEGNVGRGDLLVIEGDRLVVRFCDSDELVVWGVLGVAIFVALSEGLSEGFGPVQANLIVHLRG